MHKFQEHQATALQHSFKLKIWMTVTIVGTIVMSAAAITYLHYVFLFIGTDLDPERDAGWLKVTFSISAVITSMVVAIGTFLKQVQLRDGGHVIADDLGAQLLEEPRDPDERRLLNIVEEMSISSGIPVPPVYLLECRGINAFAAGHDTSDCVICVTRGAIQYLERDELQGVIAHEFSHILNGDIKLNLQLAGWLHGVLAIRIVAAELIEMGTDVPESARGASAAGGGAGGRIAFVVIGCALWPIGQIGAFLSALVKAALNRQREVLADAYAVEFTRNPEGLSNALKRVIGHAKHAQIDNPRAIEASHMFFAASAEHLVDKMRTHPPLGERIRRLTPGWDGIPLFAYDGDLAEYEGAFDDAMSILSTTKESLGTTKVEHDWADRPTYTPEFASTIAFVAGVMQGVPEPLVQLTESEEGSALVVYALWLANANGATSGEDILSQTDSQRIQPLIAALQQLGPAEQLLLFDTVIKQLGHAQSIELAELRTRSTAFMEQSENGNLFHWMWKLVVRDAFGLSEATKPRFGDLKQVAPACEIVLSQVCNGGCNGTYAQFSFQRGLAQLGLDGMELKGEADYSWESFEDALEVVAMLAPALRRQVALACSSAVSSDQEITPEEAFLIRGVCQRMGYDMPCVIPGQPVLPGT